MTVYGTDIVFDEVMNNVSDLHINLITFNKSDNKNNLKKIKQGVKTFKVYPNNFKITAIQLLKGETTVLRSGQPSKDDEMYIEIINNYTRNFKGNL